MKNTQEQKDLWIKIATEAILNGKPDFDAASIADTVVKRFEESFPTYEKFKVVTTPGVDNDTGPYNVDELRKTTKKLRSFANDNKKKYESQSYNIEFISEVCKSEVTDKKIFYIHFGDTIYKISTEKCIIGVVDNFTIKCTVTCEDGNDIDIIADVEFLYNLLIIGFDKLHIKKYYNALTTIMSHSKFHTTRLKLLYNQLVAHLDKNISYDYPCDAIFDGFKFDTRITYKVNVKDDAIIKLKKVTIESLKSHIHILKNKFKCTIKKMHRYLDEYKDFIVEEEGIYDMGEEKDLQKELEWLKNEIYEKERELIELEKDIN